METTFAQKYVREILMIREFWLYLKSRPSMFAGLIITSFYATLAILDLVYPEYIGVPNAFTLLSFGMHSGLVSGLPTPPTISDGWEYLLGTTSYGMPILPVMFASIASDLGYSMFVIIISATLGTFLGIFSVSYGRKTDLLFMRFTDVFLSFPAIVMVIIYASIRGWTYLNISIGILIIWWTTYARLSRSVTLPLKREPFVEAAKAAGCSRSQLLFKHLLPNVMSFIFVQITLDVGMIVSIFATVNYLFSDLNVTNAFLPEIGNMMVGFPEAGALLFNSSFGVVNISTGLWLVSGIWWPIIMPGVFLIIFIMGINLFGSGLRDYVNPKNR